MKKLLSIALVLVMLLTQFAIPVFADVADDDWYDPYAGMTVKSMTVTAKRKLIENCHGWHEDIYDENGEVVDTVFYYNPNDAELYAKVEYVNGDVEEGYLYDLYGAYEVYDNQMESPWGVGKHQVVVNYRGFATNVNVEVVKNPVKSITAVAKGPIVDGWDSNNWIDDEGNKHVYYFLDTKNIELTIKMKDGSVVKGDEEELFEKYGIWIYDEQNQEENPLKLGKNKVKASFMGVQFEYEVEILPNPYKSISLKGENELYLVFEGVDKKDSFETKIVDSWLYDYDGNNGLYGEIVTEDGTAYEVTVYSDLGENGFPTLSKNVKMEIGSLTTNTLEKCTFFAALERARDVTYAAVNYYENSGEVSGKQFEGYNADEEKNIDDLVALSTMVLSGYNDYDYVGYDDYCIYKLSVGTVEDNIENVFGITDVNVKDSSFYKFFKRQLEVKEVWTGDYNYQNCEVSFVDGKWVATAVVENWTIGEVVGEVTIVLNEDLTVYSIDYKEVVIEQGDVNCDGAVTAVDARLVLQYVAGLVDEYGLYIAYADLNGDENITAVDARMILQKVVGLIK